MFLRKKPNVDRELERINARLCKLERRLGDDGYRMQALAVFDLRTHYNMYREKREKELSA